MNDKDLTKLRETFDAAVRRAVAAIQRPNILLVGKTGAGKSSLVNTVFGAQLAAVSDVRPQTDGFARYSVADVPVNIIDSAGYELGREQEFVDAVERFVVANFADPAKQVHIAWYCVSIGAARITPWDEAVIDILRRKNFPVALVLTQADLDSPDGRTARSLAAQLPDIPAFEVSNNRELNEQLGGLKRLVEWSAANISDTNLRLGFIAAQRVSLKEKDEVAEKRIRLYAASAAGIGAAPIPGSDAVLLTGLQMKMSADLYTLYGLGNSLSSSLVDFVQGRIASAVGKMVAGSIVKAIPGAGSVVGATVNATVASSLTYALGRTVATACSHACRAMLDGRENEFSSIFDAARMMADFVKFDKKEKK